MVPEECVSCHINRDSNNNEADTPLKECYSLTEKPGCLRLYGNCFDLSSPECPAMLLRKQTSYDQTFRATVEFNPTVRGYEAGIVLWWSQYSYATVGIVGHQDENGNIKPRLTSREPSGEAGSLKVGFASASLAPPWLTLNQVSTSRHDLGSTKLRFTIEARPIDYSISVMETESGANEIIGAMLTPVEKLTVAPPVGGCFTGVMFGVYSFGKGQPVLDPADFSDISIAEVSVQE